MISSFTFQMWALPNVHLVCLHFSTIWYIWYILSPHIDKFHWKSITNIFKSILYAIENRCSSFFFFFKEISCGVPYQFMLVTVDSVLAAGWRHVIAVILLPLALVRAQISLHTASFRNVFKIDNAIRWSTFIYGYNLKNIWHCLVDIPRLFRVHESVVLYRV